MGAWKDALESAERRKKWEQEFQEQHKKQVGNKKCIHTQEEPKYDNVNTIETSSAVLLYIVTMIVGTIFIDRWLIWIVATFIFLGFIFRHDIKKK